MVLWHTANVQPPPIRQQGEQDVVESYRSQRLGQGWEAGKGAVFGTGANKGLLKLKGNNKYEGTVKK